MSLSNADDKRKLSDEDMHNDDNKTKKPRRDPKLIYGENYECYGCYLPSYTFKDAKPKAFDFCRDEDGLVKLKKVLCYKRLPLMLGNPQEIPKIDTTAKGYWPTDWPTVESSTESSSDDKTKPIMPWCVCNCKDDWHKVHNQTKYERYAEMKLGDKVLHGNVNVPPAVMEAIILYVQNGGKLDNKNLPGAHEDFWKKAPLVCFCATRLTYYD